jgi:uncharacterized protein YbbC (DUF1343 family)
MMYASILLIALTLSTTALTGTPSVKTGIEVLRDRGFDILQGKRIGLITNPTGVDHALRSTIDILHNARGVTLVALFGPEHGVRGDHTAGEFVASYTDPQTGIPVYSLYGKTRKPTKEMLRGIDVLVYDIQDIGCRSYTFISTMGHAMEAAAEQKIGFVVLDRPNPLGGLNIEGSLVEKEFQSDVSPYPIPYVYGLTCGELATLINNEGMLENGVRCSLTVVPMEGWKRGMLFSDTGLQWVPTSPHIPSEDTPIYYVSSGILGELQVISEGVGYTIPFRTFAAEWIDPIALAERMNALRLKGVRFRPMTYKPFYGVHTGKVLHGVQIYIDKGTDADLMSLQFLFLQVHHELYPDRNPFLMAGKDRLRMFDKVVGTGVIREKFSQSMSFASIREFLRKDVEGFRRIARKYYLYPEKAD